MALKRRIICYLNSLNIVFAPMKDASKASRFKRKPLPPSNGKIVGIFNIVIEVAFWSKGLSTLDDATCYLTGCINITP